jgi:GNAT superfamily N-acetyltransferase
LVFIHFATAQVFNTFLILTQPLLKKNSQLSGAQIFLITMELSVSQAIPSGYLIHDGYPSVQDYLNLRSAAGLTPKTASQANEVPNGSWEGCFVTVEKGNTVIGMGRIIGDGGWYFHIADMAVHPDHQRKGLGDQILKRLLQKISVKAPKDGKPYISLLADSPGRKLYHNNGFIETAPQQLGMVLLLN